MYRTRPTASRAATAARTRRLHWGFVNRPFPYQSFRSRFLSRGNTTWLGNYYTSLSVELWQQTLLPSELGCCVSDQDQETTDAFLSNDTIAAERRTKGGGERFTCLQNSMTRKFLRAGRWPDRRYCPLKIVCFRHWELSCSLTERQRISALPF